MDGFWKSLLEATEVVKRDLSEFVYTVGADTQNVLQPHPSEPPFDEVRSSAIKGRREVDDDASEVTPTAPSARATTSISKDVAARLQQLEQEEEDLGWGEDDATATVTVDLDVQEQVRDSEIVGAKPHDTQSNATTGHEEELSPLPQSRTFAAPEQNIGDEADHAASSNA